MQRRAQFERERQVAAAQQATRTSTRQTAGQRATPRLGRNDGWGMGAAGAWSSTDIQEGDDMDGASDADGDGAHGALKDAEANELVYNWIEKLLRECSKESRPANKDKLFDALLPKAIAYVAEHGGSTGSRGEAAWYTPTRVKRMYARWNLLDKLWRRSQRASKQRAIGKARPLCQEPGLMVSGLMIS